MFEKHIKRPGPIPFPICGNKYFIDINGVVYGDDGRILPTVADGDGYPMVFADLWDQVRHYRVADLMAIAYKNVQIPFHLWNRVEGFCIDSDLTNLRAGNIGYRFREGPLECPKYPGYFYVPMMTKYAISKEGKLINTWNGGSLRFNRIVPKRSTKNIVGGYYVCGVTLDVSHKTVIGRYRMLALAFLEYPAAVDRLDVNHIDGVPGNDELSNLEWATRSQNIFHAINSGLKKAFPVVVNDLKAGVERRYPSISQCAAALNLATDESIRWRLKQPFGKVFEDGTMVKLESDPREFPVIKDVPGAIARAQRKVAVLARNATTGEVRHFESLATAADHFKMERGTLAYRINNNLNQPYFGYQFKYVTDNRDWIEFPKDQWVTEIVAAPVAVDAKNIFTGEVRQYRSVSECSDSMDYYGLRCSLRQRSQPRYRDGWWFKVVDQKWDPALLVEGCENRIVVRKLVNGELCYFDSARHAGKQLGIEPKTISQVADSGGYLVVDGYQCKYIDDPRPWIEPDTVDRELLLRRHPKVGFWKKLTDVETGESRYFYTVDEVLAVLETVNSAVVLHRQVKKGLLLDGKYTLTNYRPKQLSDK